MSLLFNEIESKKETIAVENENTLKTEENMESMKPLEKIYSVSCPNLTLNQESTIEKFNSDKKNQIIAGYGINIF